MKSYEMMQGQCYDGASLVCSAFGLVSTWFVQGLACEGAWFVLLVEFCKLIHFTELCGALFMCCSV